jgi:hypothetical protein
MLKGNGFPNWFAIFILAIVTLPGGTAITSKNCFYSSKGGTIPDKLYGLGSICCGYLLNPLTVFVSPTLTLGCPLS